MRKKLLVSLLTLFVMAICIPAYVNAQPGKGKGWGNSPYARRLKMERKIEKERAKYRRKVAQERFKNAVRSRRATDNVYYGSRDRRYRDRDDRYRNDDYYGNDPYYDDDYYYDDDPYYDDGYYRDDRSVYRRHRNAINIGIGAGAGAVVGGIVGGKKGALIGAGVGAGAAAVYTYGINPKDKRRPRIYR